MSTKDSKDNLTTMINNGVELVNNNLTINSDTSELSNFSLNITSTSTSDPSPVLPRRASLRRASNQVLQLSNDNTWNLTSTKQEAKKRKKLTLREMLIQIKSLFKLTPEVKFNFLVAILFFLVITIISVTSYFYNRKVYFDAIQSGMNLIDEQRYLKFLNSNGDELIKIKFGTRIPGDVLPLQCLSLNSASQVCRDWQYRANFNVYRYQHNDINCFDVKWKSYGNENTPIRDCFELDDTQYWYGFGSVKNLSWPLNNNLHIQSAPFATGDQTANHPFGSIIKRYLLSSAGISIRVPISIPLFITYNATLSPSSSTGKAAYSSQLCLEANINKYPFDLHRENDTFSLEYTVCTSPNIIELHTHASKTWTVQKETLQTKSSSTPIKESVDLKNANLFLEKPIWTTGTKRFPNEVTHMAVQIYADKIMDYGFDPGIIVIDSRWESYLGDLKINKTAFHHPVALFRVLHYKGFKILLTVTPFIDIGANILKEAVIEKRVIIDSHTNVPLLTPCVEGSIGYCAVIDVYNSTTAEWFRKRLVKNVLRNYSVDGFVFKGIESTNIPHDIHQIVKHSNPDSYQLYYKEIAKQTASLIGMNIAADIFITDGFFQLSPLNSTWSALQSVIPNVLNLGIIGYSIINTGSVGGDLIPFNLTDFDRELYIRWLELAAFLPVVQFAEPPGGNDLEIIRLAKRLLKIREEHILPIFQTYLEENHKLGTPLIRPMWWLASDDHDSFTIDNQFIIGNDIVVAPVIEKNSTKRDIYLPIGWWRDELNAQIVKGGKWIRNFPAALDQVPYFKRTEPNS